MGLFDLLHQVVGDAAGHFDNVAAEASTDDLGRGIADTMRSPDTPPFPSMVGQLFGQSTPAQQAGLLNQILAALGPAVLSGAAGGALGRILAPGAAQVTPDQASQLSPDEVTQIAAHAEAAHPGIVDQVGRFYAQHAGLIKTLGSVVLAATLARMKDRLTNR